MRIAIVGTVGVPGRYGGFETLAEQLARGIDPAHHPLVLYCQRSAYPEVEKGTPFYGHARIFLPMRANGPSSMVHDALAMIHAAWIARTDTMLVLGYSGAWFLPLLRVLKPRMRIVTNIDGMEWRRNKFGRGSKLLLRTLERLATWFSHQIIADNDALVTLVDRLYGFRPTMIAYGGDHTLVAPEHIDLYGKGYAFSVARIEPENNSELILTAFADSSMPLVSIGNWSNSDYGRRLKEKFANIPNLYLLDPIYDPHILAGLRSNAALYVHGHSVGGTNPSLVEALFHHDRIIAFDCAFNRATLNGSGEYFTVKDHLCRLISEIECGRIDDTVLRTLKERYLWRNIVSSYLQVLT